MDTSKHENKFQGRSGREIALIYVGEGKKLESVPPRDLTHREVMFYGGRFYLVRSGLYMEPGQIKND